jgi:hypothetical protein
MDRIHVRVCSSHGLDLGSGDYVHRHAIKAIPAEEFVSCDDSNRAGFGARWCHNSAIFPACLRSHVGHRRVVWQLMFEALKNFWKMPAVEIPERCRLLAESDYGRNLGWYIEYEGQVVGTLDECQWCEMFWDWYRVAPTPGVGDETLRNDTLWNECRFRFRNRRMNEYAAYPFCGGKPPFVSDGKITMRGLYLLPHNNSEEKAVNRALAELK